MAKNLNGKQSNRTSIWKQLLVLFLLGGAALCLQIVVMAHLSLSFVQKYQLLLQGLLAALLCVVIGASVVFLVKGKSTIFRALLSGLLLWLIFLAVLGVAEWTDFITILQSQELYHDFLIKTGAYMPYIYIGLQVAQVLFLPLPGFLSILVGIQLFGPLLSALYSFIGLVVGSLLAFWIGRKWGYKAVSWIVGKNTLKEWQERIKGRDNLLITAMFVLPFFPDDMLCFVAGVSTMTARYFIVMMILSRAFSVFSTAYSVALIPLNTWWGLAIWAAILILLVILFVFVYKNMDKIRVYAAKNKKGQ